MVTVTAILRHNYTNTNRAAGGSRGYYTKVK